MLCLSSLGLNPRIHRVQNDLIDCQRLHTTLLSAFPDRAGAARREFGVLYRVDSIEGQPVVLVQSSIAPRWDSLPSKYLTGPPRCRDMEDVYSHLRRDQRLRFRLRANPTKRIAHQTDKDGKVWDGKRVQMFREEDQRDWLHRKAEGGGFALNTVRLHPSVPKVQVASEGSLTGKRGDRRIFFGSVLFDGELTIVDTSLFRETLQTGIGSGKAYGFGLLSIAPPEGAES